MSNSTEINTNVVRKLRLPLPNFKLSLINDLGQRLEHATITEPPEIAIQRYQERSITLFLFRRAVQWHQLEMKCWRADAYSGRRNLGPWGSGTQCFVIDTSQFHNLQYIQN